MDNTTQTTNLNSTDDLSTEVKNPKIIKRNIKVLTLISGIITILIGIAICVLSFLILVPFMLKAMEDAATLILFIFGFFIFFILLLLLMLGLGITIMVFGIAEIRLSTKQNYEYKEKGGAIVAYICFDIISIIISVAIMIIFTSELGVFIIAGFIAGASLICLILKSIDVGVFKSRVKKGIIDAESPKPQPILISGLNLGGLQELNPSFKKPNETDQMHEDLKKIEQMKTDGLINDDEYNKMRETILERVIKKSN